MIRGKIGVTWGMIFIYVMLFILGLCFVLGLSGCGTRKKAGETIKNSIEQTDKSTSEGKVTKENGTSEDQSSSIKKDKTDEKQEQRITELYDENGRLKQRITELINSKSTDKSTKDQKSLKKQYNRVDSNFNNILYRKVVITEHRKKIDIDADKTVAKNFGGSWFLILGLVIVVGAIFLYFYLKRK